MKKYEFTGETKVVFGITLRRIRAVVRMVFSSGYVVNAGDIGGWIEKENNLDHSGDAWVSGDAKVYGNAEVFGDAEVTGDALVSGNALVSGDALVYGNAEVSGDALVSGDAKVFDDAWVFGNAKVFGDAWVSGNAKVYGNAEVSGDAWVCGDADVSKNTHLLQIGAIGSQNGFTTFFRTNEREIKVACGCFYGTLLEFLSKVNSTHGESKHAKVYKKAAELAVAHIEDVDEEEGAKE